MATYTPHSPKDVEKMLQAIGVSSVDELFTDIPEPLRYQGNMNLPKGISEYEAYELLRRLSEKNWQGVSFLGCGSYDHIIPAAVGSLMAHPAFVTAYTPYQAETSQGLLQAIFEFQTYITQLTGLEVSNASLYDGSTAAAEAVSIALQSKRKGNTILVSDGVHPHTREVLKSYYGESYKIESIPLKEDATDIGALQTALESSGTSDLNVAGVLIQSPNIFGTIEELDGVADMVHSSGALFILSVNPITLGTLVSPGELGADIAVGDTQPLGLPSCFGGPTVGFIGATQKLLRKIPGRIVGETKDSQGKRSYVLTLQAREQHIKRNRATSNICSNQALAAIGSTIYLSLVGYGGLQEVGALCMEKARYLREGLKEISGVKLFQQGHFFHEFTIEVENPEGFLEHLRRGGIFGGVHLGVFSPKWKNLITLAVTEKRTQAELDRYIELAKEAVDA